MIKYNINMNNFKQKLINIWWSIRSRCFTIKYYISHRTYNRQHIIRTGLGPGYHDVVEKMLYTNFTMLVDFIEIEKAWMHYICAQHVVHPYAWYMRPFKKFRSKEYGLVYLAWEMSLDDAINKRQRQSAQEQIELYTWWTNIRPNRIDPYDHPEYVDVRNSRGKLEPNQTGYGIQSTEMRMVTKMVIKIEEDQEKEDNTMLVRLVKIRQGLWT